MQHITPERATAIVHSGNVPPEELAHAARCRSCNEWLRFAAVVSRSEKELTITIPPIPTAMMERLFELEHRMSETDALIKDLIRHDWVVPAMRDRNPS